MNKKKFLKILEEKLWILDETERKDIINEYKDNIEEKIKHGKTEEEAVSDFGDINVLAKEILSAYKINPDYKNGKEKDTKETTKEWIDKGEGWIKKTASSLSDFTKKIMSDMKSSGQEWTIERFFEALIKIIIFLLSCALLKLPFYLIESLGIVILGTLFHPFDYVLIVIWKLLISIGYLIGCGILGVIMFKEYFQNSSSTKENSKKKQKLQINESKENEKNTIEKKKETTKENPIINIITTILKIIVVFTILFPLWMINIGLCFGIGLLIYLMFQGIIWIGPLLVIIAITIAFIHFTGIIHNITFKHKKIHLWPFIVSIVMFIIGCFLSFDQIVNINYYDTIPTNQFEQKTKVYKHDIKEFSEIEIETNYDSVIEKIVDNSLSPNQIIIKAEYYDFLEIVQDIDVEYKTMNILLYHSQLFPININNKLNELIIDNLKNNTIYNYTELFKIKVTVYANEQTMHKID